jgi:membrane-associated phospholipid phosphatase
MEAINSVARREPWNKGKIVGQKTPFKIKDIWAIRVRLMLPSSLGRIQASNEHKNMNRIFFSALLALVLVTLCIRFVDLPLAAWISGHLRTYGLDEDNTKVPDLLLITVAIMTSFSWIVYFSLVRRNIHDRRTVLCQVTGTVLPMSFALKTVLKWLFGRTETRAWLADPGMHGFHWFAGTEGLSGFPSGHMLVYSPLFLALWHFYPRYRRYYGLAWFGLGVALITTQYHFLSDVIAGAYIGALLFLGVRRVLGGQLP